MDNAAVGYSSAHAAQDDANSSAAIFCPECWNRDLEIYELCLLFVYLLRVKGHDCHFIFSDCCSEI